MMSQITVIFAADGQWRLGLDQDGKPVVVDVPAANDPSPEASARNMAAALHEHGYAGQGLVLAIPSSWCLSASIPIAATKPSREELRYMLEEQLPIAAEEVAADFHAADGRVFAVTAPLAKLQATVEALQAHGIVIDAICPEALLALQQQETADADASVACTEGSVDLLLLSNGEPSQWYVCPPSAQNLAVYLRAASAEGNLAVCSSAGANSPAAQVLAAAPGVTVRQSTPATAAELALQSAGAILSGREPWINLRQDGLAAGTSSRGLGRPLVSVIAMAAVLCLCLTLAMFWRGWQYQRLARAQDQQQREVFQRLYPDRALPPDVPAYLASEQRKLQALTGQGTDSALSASALTILHDALSRLPEGVRYRLTRMRFAGDQVTLEGETRSHSDADSLAAGLRSGDRFEVAPPRTELKSQGVAFTITARPIASRSQIPRGVSQ